MIAIELCSLLDLFQEKKNMKTQQVDDIALDDPDRPADTDIGGVWEADRTKYAKYCFYD